MMTGSNLRKVEDLVAELDALSQRVERLGHRVAEAREERAILGYQAVRSGTSTAPSLDLSSR
jgi:hypothetical protein